MNLKSKSKMFRSLVEKIDIAMSEGTSFDEIAGKLKTVHVKKGRSIHSTFKHRSMYFVS
jgi:hypothetical protein